MGTSRLQSYLLLFCLIFTILTISVASLNVGVIDTSNLRAEEEESASISYKLFKTNVTWAEAVHLCSANGGVLADVPSSAEKQILADLTRRTGTLRAWLGSSDESGEGDFRWIASGEPVAKNLWGYNQPNGDTVENCVALWDLHALHDSQCNRLYPFICKFES